MERILSVDQMRSADEYTINSLGVSKSVLVERAGSAVADEIKKRFRGGRVLVCIGKGNNGADGKIVADILNRTHGFSVTTFSISSGLFKVFDKKYDIIVDCIFGTGLNREVDGRFKTTIQKINDSNCFVVSCDIPSGLNGNTGNVMGISVKANLTIAIQEYKLGHFLGCGPNYTGELVCKDIGISVWDDNFVKKANDEIIREFFQPRLRNVHKGCFGKACIIGGSKNYTGSVILSANALCALKMGVGYSHLSVPESLFPLYVGKVPECTLSSFADNIDEMDYSAINKLLSYGSIAIGMGMGVSRKVYNLIKYLLNNYTGNLLIDADGLNSISEYGVEVLKDKKCKVVLTPHIGEFSRLTKINKDMILSDITAVSKSFASEFNVVLVVKNAISVITDGTEVYLNTTGCPGMAKAGSGDVLSGIAAGIIARSKDLLDAAVCACYLFGLAGERAESMQNAYTVTASDIINALPIVINAIV